LIRFKKRYKKNQTKTAQKKERGKTVDSIFSWGKETGEGKKKADALGNLEGRGRRWVKGQGNQT